ARVLQPCGPFAVRKTGHKAAKRGRAAAASYARTRATSYSATPAATLALRDSRLEAIGIEASTSQVSLTSRDKPLPSLPITTTSGPSATCRSVIDSVPSAARPTTIRPASWYAFSCRVRLTARATGTRAAAPAEVFHAAAVILAARRSGITTPCAPKPAAERTIAPRLRG